MLAYFGERISPHMTDTPEGFLICHDVPIGRTGGMDYLARELQLDGDPERLVRVTRDEGEVFSPAALASFEGKPVTDGHPPETVRPENAAAYHKGHIQNVRREGAYMVADLHITDPVLISEVRNGVKREVSCGYSCVYEPAGSGYRQKQIRGNHVAVVPRGRAGREVAIRDGARTDVPCTNRKGLRNMKQETKLALLRAFGLAARDAEPEELERLAGDTAAVLGTGEDAVQGAEPGAAAVQDQRLEALDQKMDRLTETVDRILEGLKEAPVQDQAPEEKLDQAIAALTGDGESAEVVGGQEGEELDKPAADAAIRILKGARPVIAAMKDPEEKRRVTDALLESVRSAAEDTGAKLLAAAASARQAAQDSQPGEQIRAQQAAYDARNPHRNKKEM